MSCRKRGAAEDAQTEQAKKHASALSKIAAEFRCSITGNLLADPVSTSDGQVYERTAIARWLENHTTSPNTGKELGSKDLAPMVLIRSAIQSLVDSEGHGLSDAELREWLMGKALAVVHAERKEAQAMLTRALALGSAEAGYHLARLLLDDAAAAGVAPAIAAKGRLEVFDDPNHRGLVTMATAAAGRRVRVTVGVVGSFRALKELIEGGDLVWWSRCVNAIGLTGTIEGVDHSDKSIHVKFDEEIPDEDDEVEDEPISSLWLPLEALEYPSVSA